MPCMCKISHIPVPSSLGKDLCLKKSIDWCRKGRLELYMNQQFSSVKGSLRVSQSDLFGAVIAIRIYYGQPDSSPVLVVPANWDLYM